MVVGYATTHGIGASHKSREFEFRSWWNLLDSCNIEYDIAEILLKVALKTITRTPIQHWKYIQQLEKTEGIENRLQNKKILKNEHYKLPPKNQD